MSKDLCYILFSLQIVPIMNLKYSVGLDVSSKKIDACISVIDISQKVRVLSSKTFTNSLNGFKSMEQWIVKNHKETQIQLVEYLVLL